MNPPKVHFSLLATSFPGGPRPRHAALILSGLWVLLFFASLFTPPLLDDADATHAQAAAAMLRTGDWVTLHVDGVRYLEKAPLPYWLTAISFRIFGFNAFAAHLPLAIAVALLALLGHRWANQAFGARTGFYTAVAVLTSFGVFLFTRILIPEVLLALFLAAAMFALLKALAPGAFIGPELPARAPAASASQDPSVPSNTQIHRAVDGPATVLSVPPAPTLPTERPAIAWNPGPWFYPAIFWIAMALAVLTKGLIGLVFILAPAALFLALTATWKDARRLRPLSGILLFLVIAAPWHILAALRNPETPTHHGFLWFYFWNEHVLRFLGRRIPRDYNKLPGYLFWLQHLLWLFPWSLFLPLGVTALWRRFRHQTTFIDKADSSSFLPKRRWDFTPYELSMLSSFLLPALVFGLIPHFQHLSLTSAFMLYIVAVTTCQFFYHRRRTGLEMSPFHRLDPQGRTILLLSLFAATILLFFSLSTNQEYYTVPAYLPLLLLIAATITRAEQTYATSPSARRWVGFAHWTLLILGFAAALMLLAGLWSSRHLPYTPDIGALLAHRSVGSYTLSTSHLFDLTLAAFAALRLPAALAAMAFLLGPPLALMLRNQRRHLAATATIALTSALFLFAAHSAFARFAPLLSSQEFAADVQHLRATGQIAPDTEILLFGDQAYGSSIPFYLAAQPTFRGQAVGLVNSRSTSLLFGSTFADCPPVFLTGDQLLTQWSTGPRKMLFLPAELREAGLRLLAGRTIIPIAETSGKLLLTDRPLPSPVQQP